MRPNHVIMLVEDDDVDILSTKRAFKELAIPNPLIVTKNGEEALEYLNRKSITLPGIIILDLNMPKMNGIEFLKELKSRQNLNMIPVIVLTTSSNHQDIERSFENQVAGYLIKPMDFNNFKEYIQKIVDYWKICELPVEP